MKYIWQKRIEEIPRENGFLSSEALYELLKIIQATTDEKERKFALELYNSHK